MPCPANSDGHGQVFHDGNPLHGAAPNPRSRHSERQDSAPARRPAQKEGGGGAADRVAASPSPSPSQPDSGTAAASSSSRADRWWRCTWAARPEAQARVERDARQARREAEMIVRGAALERAEGEARRRAEDELSLRLVASTSKPCPGCGWAIEKNSGW